MKDVWAPKVKLTKEQKKAWEAYRFAERQEDRYLGWKVPGIIKFLLAMPVYVNPDEYLTPFGMIGGRGSVLVD